MQQLSSPLTAPWPYPETFDTRDPRKKNAAWILQWGRGFYSQYRTGTSKDFYHGHTSGRYELARQYALGLHQPVQALKDVEGNPDADRNKKLDFRPLPILDRYLRATEGVLKDHEFDASVSCVDEQAAADKQRYAAEVQASWAAQQMGAADLDPMQGQPDVPQDPAELELAQQRRKTEEEAALERKLQYALFLANYDQQNRECQRNEMLYGVSVIYQRPWGTRRLPAALYPGDCFFLPSLTEDFAGLQAGAHLERITLAQLKAEVAADPHAKFTDADWEHLRSIAKTSMQNGGRELRYDSTLGKEPELAGQIEVIRFSFFSTDEYVQATAEGKPWREKQAGYDNPRNYYSQVEKAQMQSVYEGTLIASNLELGYGARRAHSQLRDESNPLNCHPFYVVSAPGRLHGQSRSMVELCFSPYDTYQREWLSLQNSLATAVPWWLEFNVGAIREKVMEGDKSKPDGGVADAIRGLLKNRWMPANNTDEEGNEINRAAITSGFTQGWEQEVNLRWSNMERARLEIEAISGINGAIAAANPTADVGKGVTEQAVSGAQNALELYYHSKRRRFNQVVQALGSTIKYNEADAPLTGSFSLPVGGMGKTQAVSVAAAPEIAGRKFQYMIERRPTQQEWQRVYAAADNAVASGNLLMDDYVQLTFVPNLKDAALHLTTGIRKKQRMDQENSLMQQQQTGQVQMQSAQAAEEEKRKTAQMEHELRMQLEQHITERAVLVARIQQETAVQNTGTQTDGKLSATQLLAEAQVTVAEIKSGTDAEQAERERMQADQHHLEGIDRDLVLQQRQAEAQKQAAKARPQAGK
ncbi:hypothetical protein [Hymenobacter latericus]|uniref:hypothetical protein n=1 Tax=Hymenobacter sp. YIM 151858-1 TaxID=2987688 RepID=UPI0022278835|nr:hypothetical protein [Hymenobacter sp. YIM 151858-1]UYZ60088.1 hypothetical protein OIS50_04630 [Hymenobacter sp. YIM 151858-1]